MPTLPGKVVNDAFGVRVERADIGVGGGRLGNISGGGDLIAAGIYMPTTGTVTTRDVYQTMGRRMRSLMRVGLGMGTVVALMRGGGRHRGGCSLRGGEVPSQ